MLVAVPVPIVSAPVAEAPEVVLTSAAAVAPLAFAELAGVTEQSTEVEERVTVKGVERVPVAAVVPVPRRVSVKVDEHVPTATVGEAVEAQASTSEGLIRVVVPATPIHDSVSRRRSPGTLRPVGVVRVRCVLRLSAPLSLQQEKTTSGYRTPTPGW